MSSLNTKSISIIFPKYNSSITKYNCHVETDDIKIEFDLDNIKSYDQLILNSITESISIMNGDIEIVNIPDLYYPMILNKKGNIKNKNGEKIIFNFSYLN